MDPAIETDCVHEFRPYQIFSSFRVRKVAIIVCCYSVAHTHNKNSILHSCSVYRTDDKLVFLIYKVAPLQNIGKDLFLIKTLKNLKNGFFLFLMKVSKHRNKI